MIISAEFPPRVGGVGVFARQVAAALRRSAVEVCVVTSVPAAGAVPEPGVAVHRAPGWLNIKYIKCLGLGWLLLRQLCSRRESRVVAMSWTHDGLVAICAHYLVGLRYCVFAHGSEVLARSGKPFMSAIMRWVYARADVVIANSDYTRQILLGCGVETRVEVVNPCIHRDAPQVPSTKSAPLWPGRTVLLTASRLVRRKGHAEVIRAVARLKAAHPQLLYVYTGTGPYGSVLQSLVQEEGCSAHVQALGFVSESALDDLFSRCDIYVSPSRMEDTDYEGFGISFIEAGAFSKPVIGGRSGGVGDAVQDEVTGLLAEPGDVDSLIRQLRRLLEDAQFRATLGARGREVAQTRHSLAAMTDALLALTFFRPGPPLTSAAR